MAEIGNVVPVDLTEQMKQSYIDYAMSVIVNRALPDVRDGLKPVHRRILYAMRQAGNTPDKPYKKAARTVGDVLGKYHPHGDAAVYDALVRMAQDFAMRYPLIDGHGNFGSVDGDPPAAMRYTEARLAPIAMELLRDLEKETVDFVPNFDGDEKEPVVLPARFPNLLVNGSAGIAVGMATNIPPHNLREVIDGVLALIEDRSLNVADLMRRIPGPDFPTGALIVGRQGIRQAYETGRGIITLRARAHVETGKGDRQQIVVEELPYEVNKAKLIEQIAEEVRERRIEGISDLRDETDRNGMRIVIELQRGANANVVLNKLYKATALQQSFGIILLALVDQQPRILNLKEILELYLAHQEEVIRRRSRFELDRAEERAHILEGLRIALDHIDEIVALIRGSRTVEEARDGLMARFGLSEKQAQAILDMRLQRLTGLEREKIEAEYREVLQRIAELRAILADEQRLLGVIRDELSEIREKYGDARRTEIVAGEAAFDEEDLIADEECVVTVTHFGYVKRQPLGSYRSQHRGGRGIAGTSVRNEDFVEHLFVTRTHHWVLFFTNRGRVYPVKAYEIPEASRTARGTAVVNLVPLEGGEGITAVVTVPSFEEEEAEEGDFLVMATRNGVIKRTALREFGSARRAGLVALGLDEGDELIAVARAQEPADLLLASRGGAAIRFSLADVRPMGRTARGVTGIRLAEGDRVIAMAVVDPAADLLVVTENGFGKRTPLEQFRRQGRGGMGVHAIRPTRRNGQVAGALVVHEEDEVMAISAQGVLIRYPVHDVPRLGRMTQGVSLMRLGPGDQLVAVARIESDEANGGER
ncbi:MAG: DNA gyrase subunit A [Bacillota bacterium]|nr:DNA gyrase subunit A [Bacillota bacterium]